MIDDACDQFQSKFWKDFKNKSEFPTLLEFYRG